MNYRYLDDAALVDFLRNGHARAFEEIYRRHWYKLYGVAYHETGVREEAEELVHDVFTSLWGRRQELTIRCLSACLVVAVKPGANRQLRAQFTHRKFQEYLIWSKIQQSLGTEEAVIHSVGGHSAGCLFAVWPQQPLCHVSLGLGNLAGFGRTLPCPDQIGRQRAESAGQLRTDGQRQHR